MFCMRRPVRLVARARHVVRCSCRSTDAFKVASAALGGFFFSSPLTPAHLHRLRLCRDLNLWEFGRKELTLAEAEMPGLMAVRAKVRRSHRR